MRQHKTVLEYCNRIRKRLGLPKMYAMQRGVPRKSSECAISKTVGFDSPLEIQTYKTGVIIFNDGVLVSKKTHPKKIRAFMRAFDRDRYPELML